MSSQKPHTKIAVSVRIRPLEYPSQESLITVNNREICVQEASFSYPQTIVQGSDQTAAFTSLAVPILDKLNNGYSCTLLAYGQTGSGKTYTMLGPPGCLSETELANANGGVPQNGGFYHEYY